MFAYHLAHMCLFLHVFLCLQWGVVNKCQDNSALLAEPAEVCLLEEMTESNPSLFSNLPLFSPPISNTATFFLSFLSLPLFPFSFLSSLFLLPLSFFSFSLSSFTLYFFHIGYSFYPSIPPPILAKWVRSPCYSSFFHSFLVTSWIPDCMSSWTARKHS